MLKRGFVFIFATVLLDMMGMGLIAPVLPQLLLQMSGGDRARTAMLFGIFGSVFALMQFLCSPLLGILSDRFGRRPVIVLSSFGIALDYAVMGLAPSARWLLVGRIISGITSANLTTANAYIADVAGPDERAAGFGYLGVAFALGLIAGPATGGVLGGLNLRLPFWFAAALSLANAVYGFAVLPESLQREQRRAIVWRRANPLGALRLLRSQSQLLGLSAVVFINSLAGVVLPSVYVLYVGNRYRWNTRDIGLSLMSLGLCSILGQALLVKPMIGFLGERGTMLAGLLCGAFGMALFGFAGTGTLFVLGIPLIALWGLAPAAAQSVMTRQVSASEQGQLQGALGSLASIAALFGPGIFTLIYTQSLRKEGMIGAAWLFAMVLLLVTTGLTLRVTEQRAYLKVRSEESL